MEARLGRRGTATKGDGTSAAGPKNSQRHFGTRVELPHGLGCRFEVFLDNRQVSIAVFSGLYLTAAAPLRLNLKIGS